MNDKYRYYLSLSGIPCPLGLINRDNYYEETQDSAKRA